MAYKKYSRESFNRYLKVWLLKVAFFFTMVLSLHSHRFPRKIPVAQREGHVISYCKYPFSIKQDNFNQFIPQGFCFSGQLLVYGYLKSVFSLISPQVLLEQLISEVLNKTCQVLSPVAPILNSIWSEKRIDLPEISCNTKLKQWYTMIRLQALYGIFLVQWTIDFNGSKGKIMLSYLQKENYLSIYNLYIILGNLCLHL